MDNPADHGLVLATIAEEAAELILPLWRTALVVDSKADASPVTEADRRAEILILQRLAQLFPETPVVSEEHASEFGTPQQIGPRFFLVDPIDGTKAFVRGDPHFTVNIALIENGRPVAAAVNAPALGQTWFTTSNGSYRRGPEADAQPVQVRPWPLTGSIALVSHTLKDEGARYLAEKYGFTDRLPVDSSIKFCFLAQGDADIYPRHGETMEWDIAAGHAILAGSGGSVRNQDGSEVRYGKADKGFRNGWFVARGG